MQHEPNDIYYVLLNWDNTTTETDDIEDAKLALREGREVIKNTRTIFYSGQSHIRLYVSTPIKKAKDL